MDAFNSSSRRTHLLPLLALCLLGSASCDATKGISSVEPQDPIATTLTLGPASEITIYVPEATALEGVVRDQHGSVMPDATLAFTSEDSTTVTVDGGGVIRAVRGGEAHVVATSGSLVDSVLVIVRYHVLKGEAKARLRGWEDLEQAWDADAAFLDFMGTTEKDRFVFTMGTLGYPDTTLVVLLPRPPRPGTYPLSPVEPTALLEAWDISDLPTPTAYLVMPVTWGGQYKLYVSTPESSILVDETTDPEALGMYGRTRARIRFVGVSYFVSEQSGESTTVHLLGDTIRAFVDVDVEYLHWGVGQADVTIEGGPSPWSQEGLEAWWIKDDSRVTDYGRIQLEEGPDYVNVWMPWPTVGEFTVDSTVAGSDQGTRRWVSVGYGESLSGTITIEEMDLPDPSKSKWGRIKGRTEAMLRYWDYSTQSYVGTSTLTAAFDAVVFPGEEPGAAAAARTADEPLWRSLASLRTRDVSPGDLPGR